MELDDFVNGKLYGIVMVIHPVDVKLFVFICNWGDVSDDDVLLLCWQGRLAQLMLELW